MLKETILEAFQKYGIPEEKAEPIFGQLGEKFYSAMSADEYPDLRSFSDEELLEWTEAAIQFCNTIMEKDCFYGSELFEKGKEFDKKLGTYALRFVVTPKCRRMF